MNKAGMLVDCSHVSDAHHARRHQERIVKPIASDRTPMPSGCSSTTGATSPPTLLKALRDTKGVIGCATYTATSPVTSTARPSKLVHAWLPRHVEIAGIDSVAIGTDRSHNATRRLRLDAAGPLDARRRLRRRLGRQAWQATAAEWFSKVEDIQDHSLTALRGVGFSG